MVSTMDGSLYSKYVKYENGLWHCTKCSKKSKTQMDIFMHVHQMQDKSTSQRLASKWSHEQPNPKPGDDHKIQVNVDKGKFRYLVPCMISRPIQTTLYR